LPNTNNIAYKDHRK